MAVAGKDGTIPMAMEFVISRLADRAELAIRLRGITSRSLKSILILNTFSQFVSVLP